MTTYRWKPAAVVRLDAQVVGVELERIKQEHNGRLDPEFVVTSARMEDSPLHPHFEWDDKAAAENYRLEQASYLIRSITMETGKPEAQPIRAFVSVSQEEDRFYVSTVDALADPELRRQVIAQAWRELEAWRERHAELIEFARVFATIDEARGAK